MVNSMGTKLGNINRGKFRMNYVSVNHLVRLYDVAYVNILNPSTTYYILRFINTYPLIVFTGLLRK